MNKRRNKSVTKTKHRVQKTKRSRRLNKNRSVKGIRGNNKTKVVGKRRNTVQRGGGEINDLVGRIFALNRVNDQKTRDSQIKAILDNIEPANFFQLAQGNDGIPGSGASLLYAACRLIFPSIALVKGILEKMKVNNQTGFFTKKTTTTTMYTIIPNGVSNGSYPQHAAVQAAKDILNEFDPIRSTLTTTESQYHYRARIQEILQILEMLKEYDNELRTEDIKRVLSPPGNVDLKTSLMDKKNKLSSGNEYTAYDEYIIVFSDHKQSLRDRLQTSFIVGGHSEGYIDIERFDMVLAPTGTVSVGANAASSYGISTISSLPSPAKETWFSKIYGFHEMLNGKSVVNRLMKISINEQGRIYLTHTNGLGHVSSFDAGIPLYKSTGDLLLEAERVIHEMPPQPVGITYREIHADVKNLHANPELAGSLFQVASQFNSLEMATPQHTPEMGITIYEHDRTQGPVCAMACPTGTLYRNYFIMHNERDKPRMPQTETNQINTLETIIDKFQKSDLEYKVDFVVKNGYILPATIEDSNKLNEMIGWPGAIEGMANDVNYVIQEDVPVLLNPTKPDPVPHKVSQIYCSGFPLAYSISTEKNDGLLGPAEQATIKTSGGVEWYAYMNRTLIKMITTAMYTATLSHAVNMTKTQGKRVKVFLTLVGTGVFGADEKFVKGIMKDVIRKYSHFPIDLYLVKFKPNQKFQEVKPISIDDIGDTLSEYPNPSASASPSAALPDTASRLPHGWFEYVEPNSNRPYYANPSTGQTAWTLPTSGQPVSVIENDERRQLVNDLSIPSYNLWTNLPLAARAPPVGSGIASIYGFEVDEQNKYYFTNDNIKMSVDNLFKNQQQQQRQNINVNVNGLLLTFFATVQGKYMLVGSQIYKMFSEPFGS